MGGNKEEKDGKERRRGRMSGVERKGGEDIKRREEESKGRNK